MGRDPWVAIALRAGAADDSRSVRPDGRPLSAEQSADLREHLLRIELHRRFAPRDSPLGVDEEQQVRVTDATGRSREEDDLPGQTVDVERGPDTEVPSSQVGYVYGGRQLVRPRR